MRAGPHCRSGALDELHLFAARDRIRCAGREEGELECVPAGAQPARELHPSRGQPCLDRGLKPRNDLAAPDQPEQQAGRPGASSGRPPAGGASSRARTSWSRAESACPRLAAGWDSAWASQCPGRTCPDRRARDPMFRGRTCPGRTCPDRRCRGLAGRAGRSPSRSPRRRRRSRPHRRPGPARRTCLPARSCGSAIARAVGGPVGPLPRGGTAHAGGGVVRLGR